MGLKKSESQKMLTAKEKLFSLLQKHERMQSVLHVAATQIWNKCSALMKQGLFFPKQFKYKKAFSYSLFSKTLKEEVLSFNHMMLISAIPPAEDYCTNSKS